MVSKLFANVHFPVPPYNWGLLRGGPAHAFPANSWASKPLHHNVSNAFLLCKEHTKDFIVGSFYTHPLLFIFLTTSWVETSK